MLLYLLWYYSILAKFFVLILALCYRQRCRYLAISIQPIRKVSACRRRSSSGGPERGRRSSDDRHREP